MNVAEPESFIGKDKRGRFLYKDYDGEQLIIERVATGALWIDKRGEGPVYVRPQDVAAIVQAMEGEKEAPEPPAEEHHPRGDCYARAERSYTSQPHELNVNGPYGKFTRNP